MKIETVGLFFVAILTTYACTLYFSNMMLNDDLIYMAVYFDDKAAGAVSIGDGKGAIIYWDIAKKYCDLYRLEKRTIDISKYYPLCDTIDARGKVIIACLDENNKELCTDKMLNEFQTKLRNSTELGDQAVNNGAYPAYIFRVAG